MIDDRDPMDLPPSGGSVSGPGPDASGSHQGPLGSDLPVPVGASGQGALAPGQRSQGKPKPRRQHRISYRDPLAILKLAEFQIGKRVGDNLLVQCPYHSDPTASCSVELERGIFRCHGCGKAGTFEQLIAKKEVDDDSPAACEGIRRIYKQYLDEVNEKVLDPGRVEVFRQRLHGDGPNAIESAEILAAVAEAKGITSETFARFDVGYDGRRLTIPIYDRHRQVVNIRYRAVEKGASQKCINHTGCGSPARLFPVEMLDDELCRERHKSYLPCTKDEVLWICEGELKALLMIQLGFRAVTGTGGAKQPWLDEWNMWFEGRKVAVLYDVDAEGRAGAEHVARRLLKYAAEVRVVSLPMDLQEHPKGDVNDWYVDCGGTAQALRDLYGAAPVYEYLGSQSRPQSPTMDLPLQTLDSLEDLADPKYHDSHIQVDAVIAAEETELYRVPIGWRVNCAEDHAKCADCPVAQLKKHDWKFEPWCRTDLLHLVDVPDYVLSKELSDITGIPYQCGEANHTIVGTELINVSAVELIPDLDKRSKDRDTTIPAFFAVKDPGDRRELHGSLHTVRGFPTSDPKSGRLMLLLYDAKPAKESLDRFTVTPEISGRLRKFQPREWIADAVDEKLDSIYADIAANVSHVYERRDLHLAIDLAYHSALEIPFNHRTMKGWTEVVIIGDSGQGKSLAAESMRWFYGLGDIAVGASCTAAGLLGSCQESARGKKRWVYRWGKIPLNDRRLVVIEEASGLPVELIQRLRDARSSGRHEDTKAKLTRVSTRTRLIWIANPRSSTSLNELAHGILALRDLIGDDADIRRFDLAIFVGRGEVDVRNIRNGKAVVRQEYGREDCQTLLIWAWSRKPELIEFDDDAVEACRSLAAVLAAKYNGRLPLVLDTEQDEKLARLATAVAARTFSRHEDDPEVLRVRKCHVEVIARTLDRLYSAKSCGYDQFSEKMDEETAVADDRKVQEALADLLTARATAEFMLEVQTFSTGNIAAVGAMNLVEAEKLIGTLLRQRAIRPVPQGPNTYRKTVGFVELLKRIVDTKELVDTTPEEKFKDVRF